MGTRGSVKLHTCLLVLFYLAVSFDLGQAANFYELMGITPQASESEIKRAFRKLSLKYHPDKNPGDEEASNMFKQINRANEVLSNPDKRQIYDQEGEEGVERMERGGDQRQKGPNAKATIQVSLEELYIGAERDMTIKRNIFCPDCRGSGAKDGKQKKCPKCKGAGVVMKQVQVGFGMNMQMQEHCDRCAGRGKIAEAKCPGCRGKKVVADSKSLHINVDRGMADGDTVVFEREAEQIPDMVPGDVVFTIQQTPHRLFKRVGDNLFYNLDITLEEAMLGFKKRINHLDGHIVEITSNPEEIIQPFSWKIIDGEGMPKRNYPSEFGNLHVKMIVKFPKQLSEAAKAKIEDILQ